MKGRGALLGPEESGLANGSFGVRGLGLFLLGHGCTGSLRIWCVWWLGPALTKLRWGSFFWVCCFPGGWVLRCVVVRGWCSCPYFENCIVDASISL